MTPRNSIIVNVSTQSNSRGSLRTQGAAGPREGRSHRNGKETTAANQRDGRTCPSLLTNNFSMAFLSRFMPIAEGSMSGLPALDVVRGAEQAASLLGIRCD